jgi:protein TonB
VKGNEMDAAWAKVAWLFPVVLAISAIGHFLVVRNLVMPAAQPRIEFASGESTEVFILEESPPLAEVVSEPAPPVETIYEEAEAPKTEEILTSTQSQESAAHEPVSPPKPIEKKPTTQRRTPRAASKTVNVPQPVVIRNTPPVYPEVARRAGWEGRATVRVEVSAEGLPMSVTLEKSSGYGVLDQAALRAVKTWRFQPRMMGGVAMRGTVDVPVNFTLSR